MIIFIKVKRTRWESIKMMFWCEFIALSCHTGWLHFDIPYNFVSMMHELLVSSPTLRSLLFYFQYLSHNSDYYFTVCLGRLLLQGSKIRCLRSIPLTPPFSFVVWPVGPVRTGLLAWNSYCGSHLSWQPLPFDLPWGPLRLSSCGDHRPTRPQM